MPPSLYFVFDVESAGLHGEGFAFGYVVVNQDGFVLEDIGTVFCPLPSCGDEDKAWLDENVMPHLQVGVFQRQPSTYYLRRVFWERWHKWKSQGAQMVTDCGYPVEANFLSACIADDSANRAWNGPYPLLDLSSVLLAAGRDPVGTFERQPRELPAHNPLCDARQSARVLIETLKELRSPQL